MILMLTDEGDHDNYGHDHEHDHLDHCHDDDHHNYDDDDDDEADDPLACCEMQYSLYPWHRIPEESTICIQMGLRQMIMVMVMILILKDDDHGRPAH